MKTQSVPMTPGSGPPGRTGTTRYLLLIILLLWAGSLGARAWAFPQTPGSPFPPAVPKAEGIPPEALETLCDRIRSWVEGDRLVGAELLVIKNRRTVMHEAFGWRDRDKGEEMQLNTLFNIRSMTKPLLGAVTRRLMEEGILKPEDRVASFLPDFDSGPAAKITVGQLLTHRSGLPAAVPWDPQNPPESLRALAETAGRRGPDREPGTRFQYSDAGADVLGAVLETATGLDLEALLKTHLLGPLGMRDTGFFSRTSGTYLPRDRMAALYGGTAGAWQRFWGVGEDPLYPFPMGSQGVYSTPLDYARFLALWMDGGIWDGRHILSEESVRQALNPISPMTRIGSPAPFPTAFHGLEVWHGEMAMIWRESSQEAHGRDTAGAEPAGSGIIGYSGSDGTFAWAWPGRELMVLFFTQSRGQNVHLELEGVIQELLLPGEADGAGARIAETSPSHPGDTSLPRDLEPYVGRYRADFGSHRGKEFTVLVQGRTLAVEIPGQGVFTLNEPDEEGWRSFTLTELVAIRFEKAPDGRVESMRLAQTSVFPRAGAPEVVPLEVPDSLHALLGDYILPGGQGALTVFWEDGSVKVVDPGKRVTPLTRSESEGTWCTDEDPPKVVTFPTDSAGSVMAMTLREVVSLPRVESEEGAASRIGHQVGVYPVRRWKNSGALESQYPVGTLGLNGGPAMPVEKQMSVWSGRQPRRWDVPARAGDRFPGHVRPPRSLPAMIHQGSGGGMCSALP